MKKKDLDKELIAAAMQVADTAMLNIHQLVANFGNAGSIVSALALVAISEMHENSIRMAEDNGQPLNHDEIELFNKCRRKVRAAQEAQAEAEAIAKAKGLS